MDSVVETVLIWCLLAMILVSCVMNDPCRERNRPQSAAEAALCE